MLTAPTFNAIRNTLARAGSTIRSDLLAAFSFHVRAAVLDEAICFLESVHEVRVERRGGFGRHAVVYVWTGEALEPAPAQLAFFAENAEASA